MKQLFLLLFGLALFVLPYCQAQPLTSEEHPVTLNTASGSINGKLLLPAHAKSCHVVVLIAGSGPTDMDGNNPMMKNNSLKFLAEGCPKPDFTENFIGNVNMGEAEITIAPCIKSDTLMGALRNLFASIKPGDYFALDAFLPFDGEGRREALEVIRHGVADKLGVVSCLEIGPRYLHSTGQLQKGGPNDGVFIIIQDKNNIKKSLEAETAFIGELEKRDKAAQLKLDVNREEHFERFLGSSPQMKVVKHLAYKASKTKFNVILLGESGTGKSRLAREIHNTENPNAPFVEVACNSIAPSLFESELFGYMPGSFTGADRNGRAGFFEEANGGTIFLDEIGELPPAMQAKLLLVLQNKQIYRVGSTKPINIDVRVITATNRDLDEEIRKGNFRQDLYYRINVFPIRIPSLRERKKDLADMASSILAAFCDKYGMEQKHFSNEALKVMTLYDWPGNVRELENVIERAITVCEGKTIYADHLIINKTADREQTLRQQIEHEEARILGNTLIANNGDKQKTMEELGLSRSVFYKKLKKYDLD